MEKLTALKGMPFPDSGMNSAGMEAELQHMKKWHADGAAPAAPQEGRNAPPDEAPAAVVDVHQTAPGTPAGTALHPLDEPQVVTAEQVAHMKPWNPDVLNQAEVSADKSTLPAPTAGEDRPQVLNDSDLPHKTPWSTLASQEADDLAHQAELQAAQAEIDARSKMSLFEKENTAADKVAADDAAKEAKELGLRAKVAEEIAEEQAQWAVEQGELRTANHILATDPQLWQTDENTTLPRG